MLAQLKRKSLIVAILIFTIGLFAILFLTKSVRSAPSAAYVLSPSSGTYDAGEELDVDIILEISDAIVESASFQFVIDNPEFEFVAVLGGDPMFDEPYTVSEVGNQVTISATSAAGYSGIGGVFATIRVKAIYTGTGVSIATTANQEVLEFGTHINILAAFSGANFTIEAYSTFSYSPDSLIGQEVTDEFDIDILLDTDGAIVSDVHLTMIYDETVLEIVTIGPGILFDSYPLIDYGSGTVTIDACGSYEGYGTFITIRYRAIGTHDGATSTSNVTSSTTITEELTSSNLFSGSTNTASTR